MEYFTQLLSDNHERAGFTCGKPALDSFLIDRAPREVDNNLSKCYVYCEAPSPSVVGYYTLSTHTFQRAALSKTQQRKIPPTYNVPAALIGRLAVSDQHQGKGIGEQLLVDALRRTLDLSNIVGVFAAAVDAKDDVAVSFYLRYEFIPFKDDPEKLFLPIKTIQDMFKTC